MTSMASYSFKNAFNTPKPEEQVLTHKIRLMLLLESFWFQIFVVTLVVIDIIFFFCEMNASATRALSEAFLVSIQFVIAMIFVMEILAKLHVYSFVKFILVTTNTVDVIIIIISAVAAVLELAHYIETLETKHSAVAGGTMFVRLIRLLRLFRLLRIYRIYGALKMVPQHGYVASLSLTPNAQVLDILMRIRRCLLASGEFNEYVQTIEVDWVIDVVKTDKLGKAMVEMDQEEQKFINEMGGRDDMLLNSTTTTNSNSHLTALASSLRKRRNTEYHAPSHPQQYTIHQQVHDILMTADHVWNFDVFGLRDASDNHPLTMVGFHFFTAFGLTSELEITDEILLRYLMRIEAGYDKTNPYHNNTHAADVTQSICYLLKEFELIDDLTPLQVCAAVFSAIVHDFLHVGYTNKFLIATDHPLAVRYNDKSVLENHSIAMALDLARSPKIPPNEIMANRNSSSSAVILASLPTCQIGPAPQLASSDISANHRDSLNNGLVSRSSSGIFKWLTKRSSSSKNQPSLETAATDDQGGDGDDSETATVLKRSNSSKTGSIDGKREKEKESEKKILDNLSEDDYRQFRAFAVDMVLHTDMAKHFELIGRMEAHEHTGYDTGNQDHVKLILQVLLHMADVSNPSKSWTLYSQWIDAVMTEFRRQGQFEKDHGLPISMFMDPDGGKEMERQCQSAFIDLFCLPFVQAFHRFITILKSAKKHKSQEILDQLEANRASFGGNANRRRGSRAPPPPSPKRFTGHKLSPSPRQQPTQQTNHQLSAPNSSLAHGVTISSALPAVVPRQSTSKDVAQATMVGSAPTTIGTRSPLMTASVDDQPTRSGSLSVHVHSIAE
eukprot:c9802_g1_i1.p1 GENE.c9802_g1_i1~~c9802_g1_i1.p1  ORF type:complete len:883 (-),score=221.02 c9802_g1_i1:319-2838(-)